MTVINTNVNSLYAQAALTKNARTQATAMQQLSTGSRINAAKDDAAGMAIGTAMTSQVKGLDQAARNAQDGINMMQTAEGAMVEQTNMLQRMRELAVQASNGTYDDDQRGYLQKEFSALASQVDSIATQTTWNGQQLLDATENSGKFAFMVGQKSGETITVEISKAMKMDTIASGMSVSAGMMSAVAAQATLGLLNDALTAVNEQRASIGAGINRLTYAGDNLTNISANIQASRSTIMDTDYAVASSALSKTQIIQQAATAMLAQANQQPQTVLALLK
jgi:flagellin